MESKNGVLWGIKLEYEWLTYEEYLNVLKVWDIAKDGRNFIDNIGLLFVPESGSFPIKCKKTWLLAKIKYGF